MWIALSVFGCSSARQVRQLGRPGGEEEQDKHQENQVLINHQAEQVGVCGKSCWHQVADCGRDQCNRFAERIEIHGHVDHGRVLDHKVGEHGVRLPKRLPIEKDPGVYRKRQNDQLNDSPHKSIDLFHDFTFLCESFASMASL